MTALRKSRLIHEGDAEDGAFLGVERSARGLVWRERLDAAGHRLAQAIGQRHGIGELLGRVLAARGVELDEVPVVLDPTLKALMPDPSTLQDMEKAAERLADAITRGEPVAIFGDYDVDGGSSVALMLRFLAAHGRSARPYVPDRLREGYGPNPTAIEALVREGARLIVTVDCGTTSHAALAVARPLGADVIVIDHHQADAELPDVAAVVNPNRQDDISGLGHLCAAGVTFMVLVATARVLRQRGAYAAGGTQPDLMAWLDLVALATVCDVVPLQGLNRAFVTQGLKVMRQRQNVGLRHLFDVAGLAVAPTTYHLGFVLGPRINAGGRIGDAALGARLLSTEDEGEAERISVLLDRLNRERKAIETAMLEEAVAEAGRVLERDPEAPLLLLGSEAWHKGVVGLVASRLTEKFGRPSCVLSWEAGHEGTGSLRSIAGVDIGGAVRAAVAAGHLVKGGGHAMAAGLTVRKERLEALTAFLRAELIDAASSARAAAALEIDGAQTAGSVTEEFIGLLERAGPYGAGNPTPRFAFPVHRVKYAKVVGETHVRCVLEASDGARLDAVAFRAVGSELGTLLLGAAGMPLHVAGSLKRDTWGGRQRIELHIEDVADPRRGAGGT
ncbi:MAG: single-stranded-DNA-specific exonuclease RecJ [Hyphomicrobiaceae bacterium]|nr:single-stranded-DNA-specific exonuclease RecJ [Hyphomicrobiaceae bacterium]